MNILTVSDEVVPTIYYGGIRDRFGQVQLVLGCGDLPPSYLEFIISMLDVPCFFVPGNHDGEPERTAYGMAQTWASGAVNIDGCVVQHEGLVLGGMGGSVWYNGGRHQYTQRHMRARVLALLPRILWHRRKNGYGLDIFLTHSPPAGIQDGKGAHAGFTAFRWLLEHFPPRYHIHGHIHKNYRMNAATETNTGQTIVINTTGYRVLAIEPLASQTRHGYNHQ